ncbi:hypothetical protein ADK67_14500 [Saccharothrix sp. NRRL B-16348]|uniref:hypothetical protein n=1 Tax=Saccharothrix sp. NRRL B-16348 TaxID=1415542 RepID=UPI0006AF9E69|nr:hypothetical protein [Saccharothrix sp. NRRL B-16348]KOX27040.1 hypothetical protein ADK67_14500 [Saccharothrix sp. NRRL B-16348]
MGQHVDTLDLRDPASLIRPLTYLWAWGEAGELPASDVLARPFWIGRESAVLRPRTDRGEGREPLAQDTMDPLIWWAVEFVERFSGDCLTALRWYHDNRARLDPHYAVGHDPAAATTWLASLTVHPRAGNGRDRRDVAYLTAISPGLPGRSIEAGLARLRRRSGTGLPPLAEDGSAKPLPVDCTARINDQPWLVPDFRHVAVRMTGRRRRHTSVLWNVLQGACAVVIGYLGAGTTTAGAAHPGPRLPHRRAP